MVYKWCVVPQCTNTSVKSPCKVFVSVPTNPSKRKIWLNLARRDPTAVSPQSNIFMCEDHFNMNKDTINYMQFKMGYCQKIFLKDNAVPTLFHCQEDHKEPLQSSPLPIKLEIDTESLDGESVFESDNQCLHEDDILKSIKTEDNLDPLAEPTETEDNTQNIMDLFQDNENSVEMQQVNIGTLKVKDEFHRCVMSRDKDKTAVIGETVARDSAEIFSSKPLSQKGLNYSRKCPKCGQMMESLVRHVCTDELKLPLHKKRYICMVCSREYQNIKMFNEHSIKNHEDAKDVYFFPSVQEFLNWKSHMQRETCTNYALVTEFYGKKYYYCKYNSNVLQQKIFTLCPSVLVAQDFKSGVHVKYFDKHKYHIYEDYNLVAHYRRYSIAHLSKPLIAYIFTRTTINDGNVFAQFKILVENIVVQAARLERSKLNVLMGKALEMTRVFNRDPENEKSGVKSVKSEPTTVATDLNLSERLHDSELVAPPPVIVDSYSLESDIKTEIDSETDTDVEMRGLTNKTVKKEKQDMNTTRLDENIASDNTSNDYITIGVQDEKIHTNLKADNETAVKRNVRSTKTRKNNMSGRDGSVNNTSKINKLNPVRNMKRSKRKDLLKFYTYKELVDNHKPSILKPRVNRRRNRLTEMD